MNVGKHPGQQFIGQLFKLEPNVAMFGNVLFKEGEPILDFHEYCRFEKQLFVPVTGVQRALGDACFCSNPFSR